MGVQPSKLSRISAAQALVGTIMHKRYKVVRVLGAGSMGAVFEVEHMLIGRRFALKRLHPEYADNETLVARFHQEARAAGAIGHPNILPSFDTGVLADGSPFIVFEYLDGEDVGKLLERQGMLDIPRAAHIARQSCLGLAAAHEKGIVHRDLKPDNIFLVQGEDGRDVVKLLDFGISKFLEPTPGVARPPTTVEGSGIGTPYYMSPEQFGGSKDVDARADVWAMGIVLFEMLTGHVPFQANNLTALAMKVVSEKAPSIRESRLGVPSELEAIVERAIRKDKVLRYAKIAEMAEALTPFAVARDAVRVEERVTMVTMPPEASTGQRWFAPEPRRYSWDDFSKLPKDDGRELVDGSLIQPAPATHAHQHAVERIARALREWAAEQGAKQKVFSGVESALRISTSMGLRPDVQVVAADRTSLVPGVAPRPDLVVEVLSDDSRRRDRVEKLLSYAGIEVPEYWLVDPDLRFVERLSLKGGHYVVEEVLADRATLSPTSLPGFRLPLEEVWTDPTSP
ncbi:MAG: Uma2 family endonuclease [Deltaproteobacteria bacterium]|nr:Uma2 family endonuclease [Deltaproteobacteria bacterium]